MVGKANKDILGFPGFFKLWLLIWIRPREVMRYIVDGSFKGSSVPMILGISMLMPILQCIMGRQKEALGMLILLIIPAILINLATFFLSGFFFKWTGRLLDGKGDYDELRAVVAWSYPIKLMSTVGLYCLSMLFFNRYVTVSLGKFIVFVNFNFSLRLVFFIIISALIIFWYLWVYISCLKEVQRFSYGKAVANFLMTVLIYYLGLIIIGILGVLI